MNLVIINLGKKSAFNHNKNKLIYDVYRENRNTDGYQCKLSVSHFNEAHIFRFHDEIRHNLGFIPTGNGYLVVMGHPPMVGL